MNEKIVQIIALLNGIDNHADLKAVSGALRTRWHEIAHKSVDSIQTFMKFRGRKYTFEWTFVEVQKVNQKSVSCRDHTGKNWRVSPALLEPATKEEFQAARAKYHERLMPKFPLAGVAK